MPACRTSSRHGGSGHCSILRFASFASQQYNQPLRLRTIQCNALRPAGRPAGRPISGAGCRVVISVGCFVPSGSGWALLEQGTAATPPDGQAGAASPPPRAARARGRPCPSSCTAPWRRRCRADAAAAAGHRHYCVNIYVIGSGKRRRPTC
jgi:hypothetical protein